jgi:hypothetical protein
MKDQISVTLQCTDFHDSILLCNGTPSGIRTHAVSANLADLPGI